MKFKKENVKNTRVCYPVRAETATLRLAEVSFSEFTKSMRK